MFELKTLDDYSDESLLAELRRVANKLKDEGLTRNKFNQYARTHSSTLENRFGSWRNALDLAEISDAIAPRFNSVTRDELISNLQMFAKDPPQHGSYFE